jgi:hypothetical protein
MRKYFVLLAICLLFPHSFALPTGDGTKVISAGKRALSTSELALPVTGNHAITDGLTAAVRLSAPTARALHIAGQHAVAINFAIPVVVPEAMEAAEVPQIPAKVEMVHRGRAFDLIFSQDPLSNEIFAPRGIYGRERAVFRGLKLNMNDLSNLLEHGLEVGKVRMPTQEMFASFKPEQALLFAIPNITVEADLPVLVKIPFTSEIEALVEWGSLDDVAFKQDIPAAAISDVWVLVNLDGKPDWCKVVLQDGNVSLIPGYGEVQEM